MADSDMMIPAGDYNADHFVGEDLLDGWIRPLIAEMIGPFALVFIGAGSILLAATQGFNNGGTLVMVALAHGLALGLMIAATGHISGGHFNPAVTIALFVGGKIGLLKSVGYIAAQLIGAVVAAILLNEMFDQSVADFASSVPAVNYTEDGDGIIFGQRNALVMEIVLTFFLVYVVCGTAVDSRGPHAIASLAIGLMVTADILIGGPLTGAAMNPARHFGPALVEGEWKDAWLYWVGPIIGGLLASIVQLYVLIPRRVGFPDVSPTEHHPDTTG
jgi:MIP family channel proteins